MLYLIELKGYPFHLTIALLSKMPKEALYEYLKSIQASEEINLPLDDYSYESFNSSYENYVSLLQKEIPFIEFN